MTIGLDTAYMHAVNSNHGPTFNPGRRATPNVLIYFGALLLALAAALKLYTLTVDFRSDSNTGPTWLRIALIGYEFLLAAWLFSGRSARVSRLVASTTFGVFAFYSLYLVVVDNGYCSCFGPIAINPRYMLALDAGLAVLFWNLSKMCRQSQAGWRRKFKLGLVAAAGAVAAISLVWILFERFQTPSAAIDAESIETQSVVALEPSQWIGKPFPLIHSIDIGDKLAKGSWIVVLYHHQCSKCREMIEEYTLLAANIQTIAFAPQIALVEIPPYGQEKPTDSLCAIGRLSDSKQWFVATPTQISIENGNVRASVGPQDLSLPLRIDSL